MSTGPNPKSGHTAWRKKHDASIIPIIFLKSIHDFPEPEPGRQEDAVSQAREVWSSEQLGLLTFYVTGCRGWLKLICIKCESCHAKWGDSAHCLTWLNWNYNHFLTSSVRWQAVIDLHVAWVWKGDVQNSPAGFMEVFYRIISLDA